MIKVCDAIMGTGKSSAAIAYMNSHPSDKFIYITPYLDETKRIKDNCPTLHFVEPSNRIPKYNFKKVSHTAELISEGKNIATTHQAFKSYTSKMLENIKRYEYTLIVDENVDVLESIDLHPDDLRLLLNAGYINDVDNTYTLIKNEYSGKVFSELFKMLRCRDLMYVTDKNNCTLFYWVLSPELFTSFKDVFILTYLFEGQSLYYFMKMYNLPYERIGIDHTEDGGYCFGNYPGYAPEYVTHIKDKLHILDKPKLNEVGDDYYSLSMNWYKKDESDIDNVKNNVNNFFRHIMSEIPSSKRLCGSYKSVFNKVKGKGYTKSFLTFNSKATNAYRDKICLVYIVNLFMNVSEKLFYQSHGIEPDEDIYALSIMVQWIWRSAIRDGEEVYLYIPSRRMRTLLINWMDGLSKGQNGGEISEE
jgi:SPBc2 prophage-derived uncharacterized protein yonV